MNPRLVGALALLFPLLGLGAVWVQTELLSRQGTEWDVPVQGYDPRDILRGHYVQFQYDWPGPKPDDGRAWTTLCLEGTPPHVVRAVPVYADDPDAPPAACPYRVGGEGRAAESLGGRLYAPKDAALDMQDKLADPKLQGVIRVRLRPDGHLTPLSMTFRPRATSPAHP
jgi:hypothetical protein